MNKEDQIKELARVMKEWSDTAGDHHWQAGCVIKQLQDEVEWLRETEKQLREIIHDLEDDNAKYFSRTLELEQERDQLKEQLYKYICEDVDVIRCLKTMAYEHNHSDVPRYKDLAKRTMDKYVERCTTVCSALAQHDAEVIERAISECAYMAPEGDIIDVECIQEYANQLRQQSKDANDFAESEIKRFQENQRAKEIRDDN